MTGQNDPKDESLTDQVHELAGHCQLTCCYFEPCTFNSFILFYVFRCKASQL